MSDKSSENKQPDLTIQMELASIDPAARLFIGVSPEKPLLLEFCHLSDASDERIVTFARKHGRIEICEHKKDSWWLDRPWFDWFDCPECRQGDSTQFRTPIEAWRACARHLTAALRLAAFVRPGHGKFSASDLSDLHWGRQVDDVTIDRETVEDQLPSVVFSWLKPCGLPQNLMPYLMPDQPGVLRIQVADSVLGRLGLQLAGALSSTDSLPFCYLCGELLPTPHKGKRCKSCQQLKNAEVQRKRYWNRKASKQEPRQRQTKYAPAASV
jgi:hypothetical protein